MVVLDPPRQGCPPAVIRSVFRKMRPPIVVYVSCNPEALASDLAAILDAGYDATLVQPVDMFPHTTHIETVVRLEARRQGRGLRSSVSGATGLRSPVSGLRSKRLS
jgi:23S rRNA (uracil1939-C5)-methyltransferase